MPKHSDPVGTELIRPAKRPKTNKATKRRKVAVTAHLGCEIVERAV